MKTFKLAVFVLFLALADLGYTQTLFVEDFNYPVRDSLEGFGGWFRLGQNSPYNIKVVSPGLIYSGYSGSGIGNCAEFSNMTNGDVCRSIFTSQASGSIYLSFMIQVVNLTDSATAGYNAALFVYTGGASNLPADLYVQRVSSATFKLGIRKSDSAVVYSDSIYNTNTTYLAVVKYTFVTGSASNDTAKAYIFRSGIPSTEPLSTNLITAAGGDVNDVGYVGLSNSYAQSGLKGSVVRIDGIRVGLSWSGAVFTGINNITNEVPEGYLLYQNYPNPFNPVTNIKFNIPKSGLVKLVVYDITGKEAAVLVNEQLNDGSYKADFDASQLSSGAYFYRLSAGEFTQTKKMILVK